MWPPLLIQWLLVPQQWVLRIHPQQEPLLHLRLPPSPHRLATHLLRISLLHWKTPMSSPWPLWFPQDLLPNLALNNPHHLWISPRPLPHHWGASTIGVPSPSIWWQTTPRIPQMMWRIQLLQEGLSAPQFESRRHFHRLGSKPTLGYI